MKEEDGETEIHSSLRGVKTWSNGVVDGWLMKTPSCEGLLYSCLHVRSEVQV